MKKIFTLVLAVSLFPFLSTAQNVGVDVATPEQKLDVAGGIKIGNTANGVAGSIRWDGTNIQYHNGTVWVNLVANSDNQTLSIALNQLAITGGNSVDLSPYLDNTDAQNLGLTGTNLTISGGTGVNLAPLQNQLVDADNDTKVQVEEIPDEDVIRFDLAGNERWIMVGSRLESAGTGGSVFIGENAGANEDLANRNNTALGQNALSTVSTGFNNVAVGSSVLRLATSERNTGVGKGALEALTGGKGNTAVGFEAGKALVNGERNVIIGDNTAVSISSGSENVILGDRAGFNSGAGSSGNVFIGNRAGYNETGSNKLYIDNSDTPSPLVLGDFLSNTLQVNGTLNVNGAYNLPTADGAASGYVMTTDGSGVATWANPALTGDITSVIAGAGLINGGTSGDVTIDANPDNSTIEVAGDLLRVKPDGILATHIAANQVGTSEIDVNAVTTTEIAPNTIQAVDIATGGVNTDEIASGAVTTDEILNATILPADVDPAAGSNDEVLSIVGGVVGWNDPATLTSTLQDDDADTKIEVEQSSDEDYIRMYTSNGTDSKETVTIMPAPAGTNAFDVGRIGIGTNTPERNLHIAAPAGAQLLLSRGDITTTNGDVLGELQFDSEDDSNPSSNNASAMIRGTATENHGNSNKGGRLGFFTKQNAGGGSGLAATERMRVTETGRIEVFTNTDASGATNTGGIEVGTGTDQLRIDNNEVITNTNRILYLQNGNGGDLNVDGGTMVVDASTNNVGIGITVPTSKLEVYGATQNIEVTNTAETDAGILFTDAQATTSQYGGVNYGSGDNDLNFLVNSATPRMVIESTGEVGIATTAPTRALDVNGTVRIRGGSPAAGKVLMSADANGNANWTTAGYGILPIGSIVAWHKNGGAPALPAGWRECTGSSTVNGISIPNLNSATTSESGDASRGRFLRGHTSSGGFQGETTNNFDQYNQDDDDGGPNNVTETIDDDGSWTQYMSDYNSNDRCRFRKKGVETRVTNFSVVWIIRVQ